MKSRPNRKPDFIFTSFRRYNKNSIREIQYLCYWKEAIVVLRDDIEEYIYDIEVTEFGRIDMVCGNSSNSISWVKGLRESYELFHMEEALLND